MKPSTKVNIINRFLIKCSGASLELLKNCPRFEITKYSSIGMTIVFTTILAFVSSFFALSIIFDNLLVNTVLALLWAGIIFNLDRYIISSMRSSESKWNDFVKAIPRMLIAMIIAVIISKPMEIQIFKSEIDSFLKIENSKLISEVDSKYFDLIQDNAQKKKTEEEQYNKLLMLREQYYQDFKCECDGTCGTKKRGEGLSVLAKKKNMKPFKRN